MQQDRLAQSIQLVQKELQMLKKASSSSSSISSNFQELLLKKLMGSNEFDPSQSQLVPDKQLTRALPEMESDDLPYSKNEFLGRQDDGLNNQSTISTATPRAPSIAVGDDLSKENRPPSASLKKANRTPISSRLSSRPPPPQLQYQVKSEEPSTRPKVIHSPFRQGQSQRLSRSPSSNRPTRQQNRAKSPPKSKQDLQIKFYLPSNSRPLVSTISDSVGPKTDKQQDFFIPQLDSMAGTRTGLLRKEKESEMEKMRRESDERLARAVRKSAARKKALGEEQKRKQEKEKSRYRNITSKVITSSVPKKTPLGDTRAPRQATISGANSKMKSSASFANGELMDEQKENDNESANERNLQSTPKTSLSEAISKRMQSRSAKKNMAPSSVAGLNVSGKKQPTTGTTTTSSLSKKNNITASRTTTIARIPTKPPSSTLLLSKHPLALAPPPPPQSTTDLIEKVLEALGTKLDPFLQSVQHHFERSAAELDARIERDHHHRVQSPIRVVNPTVQENQKGQEEEEDDDRALSTSHPALLKSSSEERRERPPNPLVKNDLDGDDEAMIMDLNEPSLLQHLIEEEEEQETHGPLYTHSNTIHIHNDLDLQSMTTRTKAAPSFGGKEGERTDLHNVLVLADWVMQDIVQSMETRRKWVNMYYGPNFDPAAVIASVSGEIMTDMIEKISMEVGDVCRDYVDELVQLEM